MDAKARSLKFLENSAFITVPFFQRRYVWDMDNWRDLLEDLSDMKRSHFLGSLILKQLRKNAGDPDNILVIDGQQRLTTLSLLLKALYDTLPAENRKSALDALRPILFQKREALRPLLDRAPPPRRPEVRFPGPVLQLLARARDAAELDRALVVADVRARGSRPRHAR